MQILHQLHDLLFTQERGLDIQLREFGLALGAQVFVTEAANDLIVTIEAGHHEQLFEQLRRLRQGEELPRVRAAGYEIVPRAFRRCLGEHRRFDIDETVRVQIVAHRLRDLVAQTNALLHHVTTQVEIAIFQAQLFVGRLVVMERRRLGPAENFQLARQQLDLAGGKSGVGRAGRTRPHQAFDTNAVLPAQPFGVGEHSLRIRIEHDLQQPLAIAQVDENHPAMIAAPMHPAGHADFLADEGFVDLAAIVGAHGNGA